MTTMTKQAELLERRAAAVPRGPFNTTPLFADHALGSHIVDTEGRSYLDFCGGIGVLNVGHNHPRVVAAIKAQADKLIHTCWHVAMYEPYVELAERLNALVPMPGPNKTLFLNSGAEAVENAVKISRAATGRDAVVVFERGYHGRTLLTLTMTGKVEPYRRGFGPFAPEVYRLPYAPFFTIGDAPDEAVAKGANEALARLFAYEKEADGIACLVVEPVLGEGGFLPIHPAAFRVLREVCTRQGILLIADEVQSGFGRCGAWFACDRYGIVPDLMVMAKSLAGGMPLSAVSGPADVMDAAQVGGLGGTYGGNPVALAAALAVLDILEAEGLVEHAEVIGRRVGACFAELARSHDFFANARGLGAMCAIDIIDPLNGNPDPERAGRLVAAARDRGLLMMTASGYVIRTLMPLTISDADLQSGLDILAEAAAEVAE
jgi:4-aminobutyrate aminotransferase / (S)-3-amino-2-methylpropionate transaminase / 5-aminovalerate transaminase